MSELSGKVAVVTGASRGIGAGIAARWPRPGASVAVTARTAEEGDHQFEGSLATVVAGITDAGGVAIPIVADLGKQQDRHRIIETGAEASSARSTSWSPTPRSPTSSRWSTSKRSTSG